jgi:hypothetical protein
LDNNVSGVLQLRYKNDITIINYYSRIQIPWSKSTIFRFRNSIKGKDFVLYAGVLDLATQKGLLKLEVELLQFPAKENGNEAICRAVAESKTGEVFSDIGDANS